MIDSSSPINFLKTMRLSDYEHVNDFFADMNEQLDLLCTEKNNEIVRLKTNLATCKSDYWFMTNLLKHFSTDKDQAIADCIERMEFRKPLLK